MLNVPPVCLSIYIYIYRTSVIFGPAEAITLHQNVHQLIESSKVTYGADIVQCGFSTLMLGGFIIINIIMIQCECTGEVDVYIIYIHVHHTVY